MKKLTKLVPFAVLVLILSVPAFNLFWMGLKAQRKQDMANTVHNLRVVCMRLETYKDEHGDYPAPQDMDSLLKTLGLSKEDFFKVRTIDIRSAVYHAPASDPEGPVLTMYVKPHILSRKAYRISGDKDKVFCRVEEK